MLLSWLRSVSKACFGKSQLLEHVVSLDVISPREAEDRVQAVSSTDQHFSARSYMVLAFTCMLCCRVLWKQCCILTSAQHGVEKAIWDLHIGQQSGVQRARLKLRLFLLNDTTVLVQAWQQGIQL